LCLINIQKVFDVIVFHKFKPNQKKVTVIYVIAEFVEVYIIIVLLVHFRHNFHRC